MNRTLSLCMIALVCCSLMSAQTKDSTKAKPSSAKPAAAAGSRSIAEELNGQFSGLEREFVSAAEAMPDDKYDFAPTNGEFATVRTFALEVKHVAATNFTLAAHILGEPVRDDAKEDNGPDALKTKAEIVQYLKDSCAYTHKALLSITAKNATELVDSPFGGRAKYTRLGMGIMTSAHSFDHYGQMVEYLRMNGIIPPASRPPSK